MRKSLPQKGTYDERYKALTTAVDKFTTAFWAETSSFYVFSTPDDIDDIVRKVKAAIDVTRDIVLIGSNDAKTMRLIGAAKHVDTLQGLVAFMKKV